MKRFVAVFFLLSGVLVAGGVSAAQVLGNANGSISLAGTASISTSTWRGFGFTTSSQASSLSSISIGIQSSGPANLTLALYEDENRDGKPTDGAAPVATYSTGSTTFTNYNGSQADLSVINIGGTLGSYVLAASTSYVLIFQSNNSDTVLPIVFNSNYPVSQLTGSGWIPTGTNGTLASTDDSGLSWRVIAIFSPAYILSTPPASVPTLSEWTQLLLGLLVMTMIGWHFHRERSYDR